MANELGQPTAQEIAEKFCTEMLCNALLCEGCPVYAIKPAPQQSVQADAADWSCKSCGFENHREFLQANTARTRLSPSVAKLPAKKSNLKVSLPAKSG